MTDQSFSIGRDTLLDAYRTMKTIREFEERLHADVARGDIPGFVHLYAGEEAAATAIMLHLGDTDRIASTHRGHGHCIAKGVDVKEMMGEIRGKATGACKGKGGSMHIADLSKGMMGANGILGAGAPLACGAALAAKRQGDGGSRSASSATAPPTRACSSRASISPRSGTCPLSSWSKTTATPSRPRWSGRSPATATWTGPPDSGCPASPWTAPTSSPSTRRRGR